MSSTRQPAVSVIAVSFNHERYVLETLESIKHQTCGDFELIYADDASQDRSAAIASDWLRQQSFPYQTILHQDNRGICRTLNECLAACRGEFVQFIACDDRLLPWKLEQQLQDLANAGEEFVLAHSDAELIDEAGQPRAPGAFSLYNRCADAPAEVTFESLLQRNTIAAMTVLVRRSVCEELGGFDESLPYEDYDLWLRIARKYRLLSGARPTAQYRIHGDNLHLSLKHWREYWVLRKHVDTSAGRRRLHAFAMYMYVHGMLAEEERWDYLQWSRDQWLDRSHLGSAIIRWRMPASLLRTAIAALPKSAKSAMRDRMLKA